MADKAMYAWSPIHTSEGDVIEPGDSVSEGDVGNKADFDYLVEAGAIRPQKYPDAEEIGSSEAPVEYYKRVAQEAGEAAMNEAMAASQAAMSEATAEEEPAKASTTTKATK